MGIIYIWRKHAKNLHLTLPCETRVIWDTNNFFEQRDYLLTFKYEKKFVFLETLQTCRSFHC